MTRGGGGKRPRAKRRWGKTSRGRTGSGAKRLGFNFIQEKNKLHV